MTLSFRLKTVLGIMAIEAVMLAILVWSSLNYLYKSNFEEFDRRAVTATQLFASTVKDSVLSTDLATLDSHVEELMKNPGISYVRVKGANRILSEAGSDEVLRKAYSEDVSYDQVDDGIYDTNVILQEGSYIFGRIEMGFNIDAIDNLISDARQHISLIALLEIVLVAIFSIILGTLLTRRLKALQKAANNIKLLGPGSQVEVEGDDELAQTAIAFNSMSEELENSYASLHEEMNKSNYQKEKLSTIMDNMPSGIALVSYTGIILKTNLSLKKLYSTGSTSLTGSLITELLNDWERLLREHEHNNFSKSIKGNMAWNKTVITRSDGAVTTVRVSIAMMKHDNEKQYIVQIRDISDEIHNENLANQTNDMLMRSVTALEKKNKQILLLTRFIGLLQKCTDNNSAYQVIAKNGELLFPSVQGVLYIKNDKDIFQYITHWGGADGITGQFAGTQCWALNGATIYPPSFTNASERCSHLNSLQQRSDTSDLCVPIIAKGEELGLLHLRGDSDKLEKTDRSFINIVREQISMALYNIRLQDQLRDASIHDTLTGLYNRRFMEESFRREIHRAFRNKTDLSVIMLDIDYFKNINDNMGHSAGDYVLVQLAELLTSSCRHQDVLCRYGGEEFLLLYPDTDLSTATDLANKILCSVREMDIFYDSNKIEITISAGIASYISHGGNVEQLIDIADKALYKAKEEGRDRVCVASLTEGPKLVSYLK